jgi:hypothetical protein
VKRNLMLMFLFLSALMLSSAGNVSNASALGNYYCNTIPLSNTHIDCLRGLLDTHAPHLNVPRGSRGLGYYKCDIPDSNTWRHVNCLRASLDRNAPGVAAMRGSQNLRPQNPPTLNTYDDKLMGGGQRNNNMHPTYP